MRSSPAGAARSNARICVAKPLVVLQRRADAAQAEPIAAARRCRPPRSSGASNVRIVTGSGCMAASNARYVSYCASSLAPRPGRTHRAGTPIDTSPMPSAPASVTRCTSSAISRLASSVSRTPSAVSAGRSRSAPSARSLGLLRLPRARASCSSTSADGSTATSPALPSIATVWPGRDDARRAGQADDRRDAERPHQDGGVMRRPARRRRPGRARGVQSSCAATDGGSSSATRISGGSSSLNEIDQRIAIGPEAAQAAGRRRRSGRPRARGASASPSRANSSCSFGGGALDRPVGVDPLGAHELVGPARQQRIVEHQQLRREDRGLGRTDRAGHARADLLELAPRPLARRRAGAAARDRRRSTPAGIAPAARRARRPGRVPPRSRATRRGRPRASWIFEPARGELAQRRRPRRPRRGPRPRWRAAMPRAAASSSSPRMLLPSMIRVPRPTRIWLRNAPASLTNRAAARACRPRAFTTVTVRDTIYVSVLRFGRRDRRAASRTPREWPSVRDRPALRARVSRSSSSGALRERDQHRAG